MTLHLIDGRAGRAHITSDDIARLNTALVGEKHCVFEYFENLKCTMQSSGRAMISTGAGMVDGHRFMVSSAETVQLGGGSVGMKRIDIVYVQHSIESGDVYTGKEKVEFSVARGTPHASNPLAPFVPSNAFAMWRIPVDGINFGAPEPMFDLVPTVASMRVKLLYQNDFWRVVKHGGAVSVFARGIITESGGESYLNCKYKLPEGLRPATEVLASVVTSGGTAGGYLRVKPDGTITVGQLGGSGSRAARYGQLTFVPGM